MTQDGHRRTRRPMLVNLAWAASLLLFPVLYVASYPIAVRMIGEFKPLPAYRPVEWLIDNTPLNEPISRWADCCGVGDLVRLRADIRPLGLVTEPIGPSNTKLPL